MYEPVFRADALANLQDRDEKKKKNSRKAKQAILLHSAAMLDINECTLDWLPISQNKDEYVDLLCAVVVAELPDILNDEY
eukprot:IDg5743t1